MININFNTKHFTSWMKRNDIEKGSFCLPLAFNEKTDFMNKILFMGLKSDKTKIFKSLSEIEVEIGCGIFQIVFNNKNKK